MFRTRYAALLLAFALPFSASAQEITVSPRPA